MGDPFAFAVFVEALFRGGEPLLVEAGAHLMARTMRALIIVNEAQLEHG